MWSFGSRATLSSCLGTLLLFSPALVGLPGTSAASEVYLDITKESAKRITLALPPFSTEDGPEETALRRVLEQDLTIAGYFNLLPIGDLQLELLRHETESGDINFPSWAAWGSELLLRVSYQQQDGGLRLTSSLYDVGNRKRLLGKEYQSRKRQGIRMMHTLSDDIIRTLTGDRGISLTQIAFSWSQGASKRIAVMDYDGRRLRVVSAEDTLALSPSWFPGGKKLAYVSYRHGRPEVVVHDLKTDRVRSLAFFPGLNAFPEISPNGESMLLSLSRDGNPEIYRMEVDGSEMKRLTFSPAVDASPAWSPDGKRVAFVSDRTGSPQIYTASARGGRARRVSYTGNYSTSPAWSPKGGRIAFTSLVGNTLQLFSIDLASGENEQMTFDRGNKEDPSWAANGRHLVYSQGRGTRYRLFIMDTVTGERFLVSKESGSFTSPAWSP